MIWFWFLATDIFVITSLQTWISQKLFCARNDLIQYRSILWKHCWKCNLHYQLALEFDMNKLMLSNNLIQFDHPKGNTWRVLFNTFYMFFLMFTVYFRIFVSILCMLKRAVYTFSCGWILRVLLHKLQDILIKKSRILLDHSAIWYNYLHYYLTFLFQSCIHQCIIMSVSVIHVFIP